MPLFFIIGAIILLYILGFNFFLVFIGCAILSALLGAGSNK